MTQKSTNAVDAAELVDRFVEVCVAQEKAQRMMRTSQYNRLVDPLLAILEKLKNMNGDQRLRLTQLYSHPNVQVRLQAAITALAFDPERAMQILQRIKDSNDFPFAAEAFQMLDAYQEGRYVPT